MSVCIIHRHFACVWLFGLRVTVECAKDIRSQDVSSRKRATTKKLNHNDQLGNGSVFVRPGNIERACV